MVLPTHPLARAGLLARGAIALAYLGAVAVLRDVDGGASSGLAPLVLLPVVWIALYGSRRHLVVVTAGVGVALGLPFLVIGDPAYPPGEAWYVGVWVAIAGLTGLVVNRAIAQLRRTAAASRRDLDERLRTERRLSVEGEVTRVLGESATLDEALPRCIEALGKGLGARVALLWRQDSAGRELRCAAAWQAEAGAGDELVAASRALALERREELPGRVWAGGETATLADLASDGGARARSAAADGLHGALAVPIAAERDVHGVI